MINVRRIQEPVTIEVIPPDREFSAWRVARTDQAIMRVFHSQDDAVRYAAAQGVPFSVLDRTDDDTRWKAWFPRQ